MRTATMKFLAVFLCSTALLAGCNDKNDPLPTPADTQPNAFSFVDQVGVVSGTEITSAAVVISGIDAPTPVTVTGGTYSINGSAFTAAPDNLTNGASVRLRHTASPNPSATTDTTLNIGGVSDTFSSMTAPSASADTTPSAFSFADQTGVVAGATITSAPVTITGINSPAVVMVAGGSYSVGCTATYISTSSSISNNETVCARHTAAAGASTATDTILTVGGVSDTFSSTTAAVETDTTPAAFSFTDQPGVATGTVVTSAAVTITGINSPAAVTVAGGSYSVGCTATYISTDSTISNNENVCVRHTSSATASTSVDTTLTVGGVSDTFTSTTASAAAKVSLLPFLTGNGELRLLDPTVEISGGNPVIIDTGLEPPPTGSVCNNCFAQAEVFFTGTLTGSTVSNLHASRLAYAKRAPGNTSGGAVFKVDITQGAASNLPVRISSLDDACKILSAETTDFAAIDNSAVVVERAGADLLCSTEADNITTVIRLNSLSSAAGIDLPLVRDVNAGNLLHTQTNAAGVITGYVSLELSGVTPGLVHRDVNLANPVTLLTLGDTTGANIERSDLTHLFVTAIPVDNSLKLFRVEADGSLSPVLYSFNGFNAGNPIQEGLRDSSNLYFSDANQLLRIPVDSITENAVLMTTLAGTLRIVGNRALDTSTTPARVIFEAKDDAFTVASGVFSVPVNASAELATTLKNYPDSEGGTATLVVATQGRAYINMDFHGGPTPSAVKINTDGTDATTTPSAYWAGFNQATTFDVGQNFVAPIQFIFLATRLVTDGVGSDTLAVVNPATGTADAVIGTVNSTEAFLAVRIVGLGRYTLARSEIDRFGNIDYDVYFLDPMTASSLRPVAETAGANDIPLD